MLLRKDRWRDAGRSLKEPGQVRLIGEADGLRDLCATHVRVSQEVTGFCDTDGIQKPVRRRAEVLAERLHKMKFVEARRGSQHVQR